MERKNVKSVTIEYADGTVETHQGDEMRHVSHKHYRKGDKTPEDGYMHHEVIWLVE